jgi:hypothetical protein
MARTYDTARDSRPATPHEVNLADLMDILGKAIKHEDIRRELLADPGKALQDMNYVPTKGAIDFFRSLDAASFDAAAKAFTPHAYNSDEGMAEC